MSAIRRITLQGVFIAFLVTLLSSCALLDPVYEQPQVQLVNIRPLASSGLAQRFQIDLKIINPNSSKLSVSGMSYTLKLNDQKVMAGVAGQISPIPAYGETTVRVDASTNLLSGLRVISGMLKNPEQTLHYELETRLSSRWWPVPVTLLESGDISLGGNE